MLRHLIRNFSRNLTIKSSQTCHAPGRTRRKDLHLLIKHFNSIPATFCTGPSSQINPFDTDDYIPLNYKQESEWKDPRIASREQLLELLRHKYRMRSEHLNQIKNADLKFKANQLKEVPKILDVLLEYGIDKDSIVENLWILTISPRLLEPKLELVKKIVKDDINDVVPFLKLSAPRILKLVNIILNEARFVPGGNRLYYICNMLQLEPKVVSQYISRRLFMIEMPFDMLQENLTNMVNFGIPPYAILRDLWAFRYTPKSVKSRLERAKNAKKDKIMPWMVRCPEKILQRSLKLSLDEKKLLGDHNTTVDYLASRLGYDVETMQATMLRHPATFKVRAPKLKEILDYLLLEQKYQPYEIINAIRIFCHGFETTKKRLEELKSINCRPTGLVVVCKSQREYEKFVRTWCDTNKNKYSKT